MLVKDNKYIPAKDRDFFILLRAGLWQRVEEELSPKPDWSYILRLSCEQTVQGIVADGLALYRSVRPDCDIPSGIIDNFLSQTAQIIRRNHQLNDKQAEISERLDNADIPHYVVKGQEAAKNYPKPLLRCAGDIDFLLRREDFEKACTLLEGLADSSDTLNEYLVHRGFFFSDMEVELHGALHPNLGKNIDIVIDKVQGELFSGSISYNTFAALYIFLHCIQHFHWSGLGIRQIIDWTMMTEAEDINLEYVSGKIAEMDLTREYSNFLNFSLTWLGKDASSALPDAVSGRIWAAIRASGNMGHNNAVRRNPNFFVRNLQGLYHLVRNYFRTCRISPSASRRIVCVKLASYAEKLR